MINVNFLQDVRVINVAHYLNAIQVKIFVLMQMFQYQGKTSMLWSPQNFLRYKCSN